VARGADALVVGLGVVRSSLNTEQMIVMHSTDLHFLPAVVELDEFGASMRQQSGKAAVNTASELIPSPANISIVASGVTTSAV
jgi:hypothetical protein